MKHPKTSPRFIILEMVVYAVIEVLFLINYLPIGFK